MQRKKSKTPKKIAIPSPDKKKWAIEILQRKSKLAINKTQTRKVLEMILDEWLTDEIPSHVSELSLLFTNDSEIRKLNKLYRNKDKATDVLSFPLLEENTSLLVPQSLGDIVISLDTAKKQAKEYGVKFNEEILRLLIHGVLHLLGYDHEKVPKSTAEKMRRKERKIYNALTSKMP